MAGSFRASQLTFPANHSAEFRSSTSFRTFLHPFNRHRVPTGRLGQAEVPVRCATNEQSTLLTRPIQRELTFEIEGMVRPQPDVIVFIDDFARDLEGGGGLLLLSCGATG